MYYQEPRRFSVARNVINHPYALHQKNQWHGINNGNGCCIPGASTGPHEWNSEWHLLQCIAPDRQQRVLRTKQCASPLQGWHYLKCIRTSQGTQLEPLQICPREDCIIPGWTLVDFSIETSWFLLEILEEV